MLKLFVSSIVGLGTYRLSHKALHQMALTSNTRIAWSNKETKTRNLEWCFRPLLITLRIVGIDFKWNQQKSSVCKNLARLICLFWLVFNLATICGLASELYDSFSKVGQEKYKVISQKIKLSCLIVETAGVYAAFVFSTYITHFSWIL